MQPARVTEPSVEGRRVEDMREWMRDDTDDVEVGVVEIRLFSVLVCACLLPPALHFRLALHLVLLSGRAGGLGGYTGVPNNKAGVRVCYSSINSGLMLVNPIGMPFLKW